MQPDMEAGTPVVADFRRMGWGERLMAVLMVTLMVALPLAAVATIAGALCRLLGFHGWGGLVIAIPLAVLALGLFIGAMGNDMMDIIVGSAIVLVLAAFLWPVFSRAREATRRTKEKQQLQQLRNPAPLIPKVKAVP